MRTPFVNLNTLLRRGTVGMARNVLFDLVHTALYQSQKKSNRCVLEKTGIEPSHTEKKNMTFCRRSVRSEGAILDKVVIVGTTSGTRRKEDRFTTQKTGCVEGQHNSSNSKTLVSV